MQTMKIDLKISKTAQVGLCWTKYTLGATVTTDKQIYPYGMLLEVASPFRHLIDFPYPLKDVAFIKRYKVTKQTTVIKISGVVFMEC